MGCICADKVVALVEYLMWPCLVPLCSHCLACPHNVLRTRAFRLLQEGVNLSQHPGIHIEARLAFKLLWGPIYK